MQIVRRTVEPAASLSELANVSPLLRRIYAARGIRSADDLDLRLGRLHSPQQLRGIDQAVSLLVAAIQTRQDILIVGDFDADGATGTAVAVRGLRLLGAERVRYRVPNRFLHGYGLSVALVEELLADKPDLLITVDSGINCVAGVAAAAAHRIPVLITDHHLPGPRLPEAAAIVNPNQSSDSFPSKALAGVGVMFYLLLALRAALRDLDWFGAERPEPDLSSLLDLVALGTVADLVPLDHNNRVLVRAGLKRMRARAASAGITALIEASGRDASRLSAMDLGFALGPRINAAGRLEDMAIGIECLLCDDPEHARALAARLSSINAERQGVQEGMVETALKLVQELEPSTTVLPPVLTMFDPDWHQGVVGLVASKLKEKFHRPVFAFAPDANEPELLKGSARSIAGVHLRDLLADVDASQPGLILRFGGHAMAAGLTLEARHLDSFKRALQTLAATRIDPALLGAIIETDGELHPRELTLDTALALAEAGPFGQGFPEPCFDGEFNIVEAKVMAEKHLSLVLADPRDGRRYRAVWFSGFQGQLPSGRWRFVYQPINDEWRGESRFRLLLRFGEQLDSR